MKMEQPRVAIIIATYVQEELLKKCLKSLKTKTDYKNYRVYLIDDSGKNKFGKEIKKSFKEINLIINKENKGFAKSNNLGIKKALKEYNPNYFLLLNDDTMIIDKNWLKKIISEGEKNKKAGILGCKIIYPDNSLQWVAKNNKICSFDKPGYQSSSKEFSKIQKVGDIMGVCFLIKREVINKIGFLDEGFSPFYGEETDFCYRASKKGFDLIYVGNTELVHHGKASTTKLEEDYVWYVKKKNGVRIEWLNYNFANILKYTFLHFASLFKRSRLSFIKKLNLLIKAYKENINNLKEIKVKRKERK